MCIWFSTFTATRLDVHLMHPKRLRGTRWTLTPYSWCGGGIASTISKNPYALLSFNCTRISGLGTSGVQVQVNSSLHLMYVHIWEEQILHELAASHVTDASSVYLFRLLFSQQFPTACVPMCAGNHTKLDN